MASVHNHVTGVGNLDKISNPLKIDNASRITNVTSSRSKSWQPARPTYSETKVKFRAAIL